MSVGAIVGAAAQIGQSIYNAVSQSETNLINRQMVREQNAWNLAQWRRENVYNSPINVMMRLRAAGLNPALMYEGGAGQLASAPSPEMQSSRDVAPQMTGMPTMADVVNSMSQAKLAEAQADLLKSQTKTEEQLRDERLNSLVISNRNMAKQTEEIAERIKTYADQHKLTEAQLDQLKFDRVMQGKQYLLDKKRLVMDERMTDKQIEKLDADIQKAIAEKNVTQRQYQEMVWTFAIRKSGLANQVNLSAAQISQANATARKLGLDNDMIEGRALQEKYYSESLQGRHGYSSLILASVRSGIQMITSDIGNVFGILK